MQEFKNARMQECTSHDYEHDTRIMINYLVSKRLAVAIFSF